MFKKLPTVKLLDKLGLFKDLEIDLLLFSIFRLLDLRRVDRVR